MLNINTWYLPSWYGDIRLDADGTKKTNITFFKLSGAEVNAMEELRKVSTGLRRNWAKEEDWEKIPLRAFEQGDKAESMITLAGPIDKIEKILTKALRPERKVLRVVRIGGGNIEEIHARDFDAAAHADAGVPATEEVKEEAEETAIAVREEDTLEKPPAKPLAAATTLAAPVQGCPAPDFDTVHKKATRVLKAFLTPQQVDDFERRQRFIVTGADTGHRYMLTSRNAPEELTKGLFLRTVFDLDEKRAFCVHDWGIPAEEEVLTMAMFIQLPGRESYIRDIPDPLGRPQNFVCGNMPN